MKENFIETENGKVYYWRSDLWDSTKPTIFFLLGLLANHTMFLAQYQHFAKNYNIIMWDAPAHGKSRPFQTFDFDVAARAARQILEYEEVKAAIFVGQSLGGMITQAVIKRFPDIVMAFVAIDSCPYGDGYYSKIDKWLLRHIKAFAAWYPLNVMKRAMAKQVSVSRLAFDNMISMVEPYNKQEMCHLMAVGYAGFLEDNSEIEITCPTLLIVGSRDITGKVKSYCRRWSWKTGFPLVVIVGAAHNSNVDKPTEVNEAIERFLAEHVVHSNLSH